MKTAFEILQSKLTIQDTNEFREKHLPEILESMEEYAAQKQSPIPELKKAYYAGYEECEKWDANCFTGWREWASQLQSTQEGGTVEAEEVLDKFVFFPQYIKDDVIPAMTEYASKVSATDKKRISELEKEVERVGIMLVKAMGEVNDRDLEVERLEYNLKILKEHRGIA